MNQNQSNPNVAQVAQGSERRMNQAIAVIAICMLSMLVGMLFDVPGLIFYPVPALFLIFLLMGGVNLEGRLGKVLPGLIAYAVIFGGLFIAMGILQNDTTLVFGLPVSTAILVYLIWPFTTLTSGALYAWVYQTWLSKSHLDDTNDAGDHQPPFTATELEQ